MFEEVNNRFGTAGGGPLFGPLPTQDPGPPLGVVFHHRECRAIVSIGVWSMALWFLIPKLPLKGQWRRNGVGDLHGHNKMANSYNRFRGESQMPQNQWNRLWFSIQKLSFFLRRPGWAGKNQGGGRPHPLWIEGGIPKAPPPIYPPPIWNCRRPIWPTKVS